MTAFRPFRNSRFSVLWCRARTRTVAAVALIAAALSGPVPRVAAQVAPGPVATESAPTLQEELVQAAPGDPWLDRMQAGVYRVVWRSGMSLDRLAGSRHPEQAYYGASGRLAVALLWNEFEGFEPIVRFRVDLPLPQLNDRFRFFIGRLDPDEFVTERDDYSGAFPRDRGGMFEEDETLVGILYGRPDDDGSSVSASAGARLRSSFDPYAKVSYQYRTLLADDLAFSIRETVFWQRTERWGLTSRVDFETIIDEVWLLRWRTSGTISQESDGVRGFSNLTATRSLGPRNAISFRLGLEGESEAEVPVRDYGLKVAYRRSVLRDWLVLELRTDLTWPRELREQPRKPSWGFGVGFEMYFGDEEFSSQPVTF